MANGRYQSRVFNFVAQQSLRLRSQSAQTFRRVKLATVWGMQILLYPLYVGFQSTRLLGKQLQQTSRQALPRLRLARRSLQSGSRALPASLPTADTPIQNLLQAVFTLPVSPQLQERLLQWGQQDSSQSLASGGLQPLVEPTALATAARQTGAIQIGQVTLAEIPTVHIRAIASLLPTGNLVLVTDENRILDILSFEQQTQLTRQMVGEIAHYGRQQRLYNPPVIPSPFVSRFLPPVPQSPNALPPIRLLQKIMGWMQRGAVAVSADLFEESQLAIYDPPALALPEDAETALRSAQSSWVMMEVQFYDWLEQAGETTTDLLLAALKSGQVTFQQLVERFAERLPQQSSGSFETPLDASLPHSTTLIHSTNGASVSPHLVHAAQPNQPTQPIQPIQPIQPTQPTQPTQFPLSLPQLPAPRTKWSEVLDRWLSKIPGLKAESVEPLPDVNLWQARPWLTMEDLFGASQHQPNSPLGQISPPLDPPPIAPSPLPPGVGELPAVPPLPAPGAHNLSRRISQSLRQILPNSAGVNSTENPASWELIDTAALETAIKTKLTQFRRPNLKPDSKPNSPASRADLQPAAAPNPPSSLVDPMKPRQSRELGGRELGSVLQSPCPFDPYDDDQPPLTSLDTANQQEDAMLPQNWIETEAQLVEYVKHPLEHLFEWLDRGMVWLEERIVQIWRWLNRPIP